MGYSPLAIWVMKRNFERAVAKHKAMEMSMLRQELLHEQMLEELEDFFSEHNLIIR
jgi:hypothetical protein